MYMRPVLLALLMAPGAQAGERVPLQLAPAPVENPLKGLVPYQGDVRTRFPHTLEFQYIAYGDLVKGANEFDWRPLEKRLDDIASRGHQAIFRVYLEYPGKKGVIPEFLIRDGLKVHHWLYTETQPLPPAPIVTPDYEDANLRKSLTNFIAAFGQKYDGDPRLGFLTAGLLGTWGEWHTYPREELFASQSVQQEVLDAYEAAFRITPILLRYPAGESNPQYAKNAHRKFGYHDDSFAWATLETGKKSDAWFFLPTLKAAGPDAVAKWKTHPIGGEIRPEAWGQVFDPKPGSSKVQSFRDCVEATHASWLMDSGMFQKNPNATRRAQAEDQVRRLGYDFHLPGVTIEVGNAGKLTLQLEIENRGVAPFYYDWKPEYGLLREGKIVATFAGQGKLTGLLPGEKPRLWNESLDVSVAPPGDYKLVVRVPNMLKNAPPLRFANREQDADSPGWLTLGRVSVP
jgi:hypothetical protein